MTIFNYKIMNREKDLNCKEKKSYIQPSCDIIKIDTESLLVEVSGNLPGGSPGTDMGGGEDEEPITMPAKSFNLWDDSESEGW